MEWGGVPVGTVISFMGNNAPTGYLKCDGSAYNIVDYPLLANHFETEFGTKNYFGGDGTTTFKVPDLKGEFLRCTGTNSRSNQGSGASVGTHQNSSEVNINRISDAKSDGNYGLAQFRTNGSDSTLGVRNSDSDISGGTTWHNVMFSAKGTDTVTNQFYHTIRPTNTSVWYCIKY